MSNNYEIKIGIRNGIVSGLIAGFVMAIPMFAMHTVNLATLIPTSVVIGAIYGILTTNNSIRPTNAAESVALGIITGLVAFAVLSKTVAVPHSELLVPVLQYALFGAVLGWVTSFIANKQEQKIGVSA